MKRTWVLVVGGLVALIVVTGAIYWVAASRMSDRAARAAWPSGLGSLASLSGTFPKRGENEAARTLMQLTAPLGLDFKPAAKQSLPEPLMKGLMSYLKAQHESGSRTVPAPPPEVARFLADHAAQLDAVRNHLLQHEPAWPFDLALGFDAPIPNLLAHMHLGRLLIARGVTGGSWDDLHAAWRLSQSLQARPEMITQLIALALARSINAAAWKLPQPAPAWLEEMRAVDHVQLLNRGLQYDAWSVWQTKDKFPAPLLALSVPRFMESNRVLVGQFSGVSACGPDTDAIFAEHVKGIAKWDEIGQMMTPNLASAWRRAFRYRAEREATANALRIAAGQPIVTRSECSDGAWKLENGTLAFSNPLPKAGEQDATMPLALQVTR
ncbi:MAG TPA: hypothetical protein VEK57_13685 [Thermoanaerobaculia bacterium]|nr:hypothetical protein [Thermoanaerobaculia bacterium]